MRCKTGAVVVGLCAAAVIAGCGSSNDNDATSSQPATSAGATTAAAKPAKVAWLEYAYADYQQAEVKGLKAAVQPGGGSVTLFNANFDAQKQQQQCQDAVGSGRYNVIVLAPVSPPTGVPCVQVAKAAGIPVVAFESVIGKDPEDMAHQLDGVVGTVGFVPSAVREPMDLLVSKACAGKDPCQVIADTIPGDPTGEALLKALGGVSGAKIVQNINSAYDPAQMAKLAPDALAAHPGADVLVTLSDGTALAAAPAVKAAGLTGKVSLIGNAASRQGVKAVEDGVLFGTTGNWPVQAGKAAGEMAVKAVNHQPIDPPTVDAFKIDTPQIVTKENAAQFTPEWGAAAS